MSSWTIPRPVEPKVSIAKNSPSSMRVASPPEWEVYVCVCVCVCVSACVCMCISMYACMYRCVCV